MNEGGLRISEKLEGFLKGGVGGLGWKSCSDIGQDLRESFLSLSAFRFMITLEIMYLLIVFVVLILAISLFRSFAFRKFLGNRLTKYYYITVVSIISIFFFLLRNFILAGLYKSSMDILTFLVGTCAFTNSSESSISHSSPDNSELFTYTSDLSDSLSSGLSSSVNQPIQREQAGPSNVAPQPIAPPVAQEQQHLDYPYIRGEIIGGDSVEAIERRLLSKYSSPSEMDIQLSRINAEELFEIKVDIIRIMADLDPRGDWMERGARALDNPRTVTGEPSLERLSSILINLTESGVNSLEFLELKGKVFLKRNP